jgi:hypothetical protein
MRDRINLNQAQFNIQLSETINSLLPNYEKFLTRPVFVSPTLLDQSNFQMIEQKIRYPRDFRLLRCLSIVQWYFPEELHYRILLDLEESSFSWLKEEQKVQLSILISSKENMEKFLFETNSCTGSEIFGNYLNNDLKDLMKLLNSSREIKVFDLPSVVKPIRRRGYKDKGSRRPAHRWLAKYDFSFTEYQLQLEEEKLLTQQLIQTFLSSLNSEEFEQFRRLEEILHQSISER